VCLFIPGNQIAESVCFFHILSGITCSENFKEMHDSRKQHGEENLTQEID
jgi:hypothetical protein